MTVDEAVNMLLNEAQRLRFVEPIRANDIDRVAGQIASQATRIAALRAALDMMPSLAFAHDRRRKADEALDADDKAAT